MTALLLVAALACHDVAHHQRDAMKHRKTPAVMVANPPALTVAAMLDWPVPVILAKRADVPVDPRERQVYQLTAVVRLMKLSDDDCDIHLELAASGDADAPRVIVEIPAEQTQARADLAALVGRPSLSPRRFDGDDAPGITVTGYAFLDLAHANNSAHRTKEGHGHGTAAVKTLWELHPVFTVERSANDGRGDWRKQ